METRSVFEFRNYRQYLKNYFSSRGNRSGLKARAAKAVGIHTSYLSQILSGKVDLSPEQAVALAEFMDLEEMAAEYFMLLVYSERAGSVKLKNRIERLIEDNRKKGQSIKERIPKSSEIIEQEKVKFYSTPIYAAIHVLVSIPQFQKKEALAEALRIPLKKISRYLNELVEMGVVKIESGSYIPGSRHIHLDRSSPLINKLHSGWRAHTLSRLDRADSEHTHYSAAFSLSNLDAENIREKLLQFLKENLNALSESKEETAYVLSLDYYPLVEK